MVFIIVQIVGLNCLLPHLSLIAEQDGRLFRKPYQELLKQKLIVNLEWLELSIIVLSAESTMAMFLMMGQVQLEKDFATTAFV